MRTRRYKQCVSGFGKGLRGFSEKLFEKGRTGRLFVDVLDELEFERLLKLSKEEVLSICDG